MTWPAPHSHQIAAKKRRPVGYYVEDGIIQPSNAAAERWLEMAAFDRLKRLNTESYQRLMNDIIGVEGRFKPPSLTVGPGLCEAAAARVASLFRSRPAPSDCNQRRLRGARWPKKMIDVAQIAQCCA